MTDRQEGDPCPGADDARPAGESQPGLTVRRVRLSELHHDPANVRLHDERNINTIVSSIKTFGQVEPLVVQKGTNKVIGGNGRLTAMLKMGRTEADVVELDIDNLAATGLALALNRTAELADWDQPALAKTLDALRKEHYATDSIGFYDGEIDDLLKSVDRAVKSATREFTLKDAAESHPQLAAFLAARQRSKDRYADRAQTNYWVCLVFQNYEQKEQFIKAPLLADVPWIYGIYVDGQTLAGKIGVAVTPNAQPPIGCPIDEKLAAMTIKPAV